MAKNYTFEQVENAIIGSNGNISVIATRLKCSWDTARKYITSDKELKDLFIGETERILDTAESIVFNAITDEADPKTRLETAKWLLSVKGYSRGYNIKQKDRWEKKNAIYNPLIDYE